MPKNAHKKSGIITNLFDKYSNMNDINSTGVKLKVASVYSNMIIGADQNQIPQNARVQPCKKHALQKSQQEVNCPGENVMLLTYSPEIVSRRIEDRFDDVSRSTL